MSGGAQSEWWGPEWGGSWVSGARNCLSLLVLARRPGSLLTHSSGLNQGAGSEADIYWTVCLSKTGSNWVTVWICTWPGLIFYGFTEHVGSDDVLNSQNHICSVRSQPSQQLFVLWSSKDRIPFLMHDNHSGALLRTTNIKEIFPGNITSKSSDFTWEELQSLNAGDWFLKVRSAPSYVQPHEVVTQQPTWSCLTFQTDPLSSVSALSEEDKAMARNQTIPSLKELLQLAKQHNISVMFDLYTDDQENDTENVVDTILWSGIDPGRVSIYDSPSVIWLKYPRKHELRIKQIYFTRSSGSLQQNESMWRRLLQVSSRFIRAVKHWGINRETT